MTKHRGLVENDKNRNLIDSLGNTAVEDGVPELASVINTVAKRTNCSSAAHST